MGVEKLLDLKELSEKETWHLYQLPETRSCDKGSHKERSLANQPNHQNHWKKLSCLSEDNVVSSREIHNR